MRQSLASRPPFGLSPWTVLSVNPETVLTSGNCPVVGGVARLWEWTPCSTLHSHVPHQFSNLQNGLTLGFREC